MSLDVSRVLQKDKLVDQLQGLAFGVVAGVIFAVGINVYDLVVGAPDSELLTQPFWVNVGITSLITAIRSGFTAAATALGYTIKGVSSGS